MAQAGWHSCSKLSPSIFSSTPSLLCSQNKAPARQGRGRLNAPSSLFWKAMLQHSFFPLWVCWCTGFGIWFNDQNRTYVLLGLWCVLSVVLPPAAPCQEDVEVEEDAGELKVFLAFLRANAYYLPSYPQKCYDQLSQSPCGSQKRKVWELRKPAISDKVLPDESSDCYEQNRICTSGHTTLLQHTWKCSCRMLHSLQKEGKTGFFSFLCGAWYTCAFVDLDIIELLE